MKKPENDPRLQEIMYSVLQGEIQKEDAYIARIKQDTTPVPDTLLIRLKRLLDDYYQKDKKRKHIRHVFLIAAIIAVLALGACVAIEPLREFVFGAIITKYEEYFDFKWQDVHREYDVSNSPEIPHTFDYVPEGYELLAEEHIPGFSYYKSFENQANQKITYEVKPKWSEQQYDINYTVSSEQINGFNVIVLEDHVFSYCQLIWADDYYSYRINGYIDREELLNMVRRLN